MIDKVPLADIDGDLAIESGFLVDARCRPKIRILHHGDSALFYSTLSFSSTCPEALLACNDKTSQFIHHRQTVRSIDHCFNTPTYSFMQIHFVHNQ